MAKFIVRVELRAGPTAADYVNLHARMEAAGFSRFIRDDVGGVYQLPTAEYALVNEVMTLNDVRDRAQAIATSVKVHPLVLVTCGQSTWSLIKV